MWAVNVYDDDDDDIIIIIIISTHTAGSANVEAQKGLILQTALYAPLTVRTG
jgi:hypothetical protein